MHPEARGREHEVRDPCAAVGGPVESERFVVRNERHVRRTEEAEVLASLLCGGRTITASDSDGVVELKPAFATPGQRSSQLLAWP